MFLKTVFWAFGKFQDAKEILCRWPVFPDYLSISYDYGLTYRSVSIIPSVIDTVTSKKVIDVFYQSGVNFIVDCILLMLSINDFSFSSPWSQRENISIYLHHRCDLNSAF